MIAHVLDTNNKHMGFAQVHAHTYITPHTSCISRLREVGEKHNAILCLLFSVEVIAKAEAALHAKLEEDAY